MATGKLPVDRTCTHKADIIYQLMAFNFVDIYDDAFVVLLANLLLWCRLKCFFFSEAFINSQNMNWLVHKFTKYELVCSTKSALRPLFVHAGKCRHFFENWEPGMFGVEFMVNNLYHRHTVLSIRIWCSPNLFMSPLPSSSNCFQNVSPNISTLYVKHPIVKMSCLHKCRFQQVGVGAII